MTLEVKCLKPKITTENTYLTVINEKLFKQNIQMSRTDSIVRNTKTLIVHTKQLANLWYVITVLLFLQHNAINFSEKQLLCEEVFQLYSIL